MTNLILEMLEAIEQNKSFTQHSIQVIPEWWGSRVFLFGKLFAIIDTDKKEIFVEPTKQSVPALKYTQALLDYFETDVFVQIKDKEVIFVRDSLLIATDFLIDTYGE